MSKRMLLLLLGLAVLANAGMAQQDAERTGQDEEAEEREAVYTPRPRAGDVAPNPLTEPVSLAVSDNIELSSSSNLFKDGDLLLWTDGTAANTALGQGALASATVNAFSNTAVGYQALASHEGYYYYGIRTQNTAVGAHALTATTTGEENVAVGAEALEANTEGRDNVAVGFRALEANTVGYRNIAIGEDAMQFNTGGLDNVAVGADAMETNVSGNRNVALGSAAMRFGTDGSGNTAVGYSALLDNDSGVENVAIGSSAMRAGTSGSSNVAVGHDALRSTTGDTNTALGTNAGRNVSTGGGNVLLGYSAGIGLMDGSDNILIDHPGTGYSESNTIRIGNATDHTSAFIAGAYGVAVGATNHIAYIDNNGKFGMMSSSRTTKEAIHALGDRSRGLHRLTPVSFRFKNDEEGVTQFGLIAEEVADVFPELVSHDEEGRPRSVHYNRLTPLLLNEVQRQEQVAVHQAGDLAQQQQQIEDLRRSVRSAYLWMLVAVAATAFVVRRLG